MFNELRPENWTNVDLLLKPTLIAGLAWMVLSVFIYWRRSATNLTPVDVPARNPSAQPDFLSVDQAKRKSALKRGDQFQKSLDLLKPLDDVNTTTSTVRAVFGFVAVGLSMLSLATVFVGSIWPASLPASLPGRLLAEAASEGRLIDVVQRHPIAISIALLAVGGSIWHLATGRKREAVST